MPVRLRPPPLPVPAATCLVALLQVSSLRDIWVTSLCNFSHLHSPATMKQKNALAFKALLGVALQVGDCLDERWVGGM